MNTVNNMQAAAPGFLPNVPQRRIPQIRSADQDDSARSVLALRAPKNYFSFVPNSPEEESCDWYRHDSSTPAESNILHEPVFS